MAKAKPELTDQFSNLNESTLCCPVCGDEFLHQCGVEVFSRETEDSETGQHVNVRYNGEVKIDSDTTASAGNPSRRRDGIRVMFSCEQCHTPGTDTPPYELMITQHKGNESVSWDVPDER